MPDLFTAETPGGLSAAGSDVVEGEAIEATANQICGHRAAHRWAAKGVSLQPGPALADDLAEAFFVHQGRWLRPGSGARVR